VKTPRRGEVRLALEILSAYARARWLLRRYDLPTTIRILRAPLRRQPADSGQDEAGVRLGHAVGRVLDVLPLDGRCLMRALVLSRLLAVRGIDSSLVIGVTAEPEFGAHAWVQRGEIALLPRSGSAFEQLVEL
jgi:hypothetical protein